MNAPKKNQSQSPKGTDTQKAKSTEATKPAEGTTAAAAPAAKKPRKAPERKPVRGKLEGSIENVLGSIASIRNNARDLVSKAITDALFDAAMACKMAIEQIDPAFIAPIVSVAKRAGVGDVMRLSKIGEKSYPKLIGLDLKVVEILNEDASVLKVEFRRAGNTESAVFTRGQLKFADELEAEPEAPAASTEPSAA